MKLAIFYHLPASGAKRVVYEHAKGLKKKGHSVDIYTYANTNDTFFDPSEFATHTYTYSYKKIVLQIPFFRKISSDLSDFILLKNLHRRMATDIDSRGYDSVLVHTDAYTQAPFLLQFLKTNNVYFCLEPLRIAYEYAFRIEETLGFLNRVYESCNRSLRKIIDRTNARSAGSTIAISLFGRELMIQAFDLYPSVSYLGVDTEIFKKKSVKKKNQILFVGQKVSVNGYDLAIQAIERLPKKNRPTLVVLSWTKNKSERITDEELATKYNESLLTLSLSTLDTFGLVPLESLACGTPVIAFNVAGYRETMQEGQTGFLVDFKVEEITEKIQQLIEDTNLQKKIGDYGSDWVKNNWTWKKHINHLETRLRKNS